MSGWVRAYMLAVILFTLLSEGWRARGRASQPLPVVFSSGVLSLGSSVPEQRQRRYCGAVEQSPTGAAYTVRCI